MKREIFLMKSFLIPIMVLFSQCSWAQEYMPQDQNSTVKFTVVNHLIGSSTVTGYFKGLEGIIKFNPQEPQASSFNVSVGVATIHTGIGMRDNDLKREKFFNADKFPKITIKSTSVSKGGNAYVLHGILYMKGISRQITIPFTAKPFHNGYIFSGTFTLNRMDYQVGEGEKKIDDKVDVSLNVYAARK